MFDRPRDYDTASDNIVRVHASMFRKRLEQYFSTDGSDEPLLIEIPKGNYAPAFRRRAVPDSVPGVPVSAAPSLVPVPPRVLAPARRRDRRVLGLALVAAFFACCTLFLLLKPALKTTETDFAGKPSLRQFWSAVFHTGQRTDIVLDDAGVGLYQELSGRALGLSEYFDRSYLRGLNGSAGTKLDPSVAQSVVLRRQSNFASTTMLWRICGVVPIFETSG